MKTIVTFLFILFCSFGAFAQHDFSLKPMPKIDFNTGKPIADTTNFSLETFKLQTDYKQYFLQNKKPESTWFEQDCQSNMPIAKAGSFTYNMPIAVPDSSINYAIRIKRFGVINSIEKK